MSVPIAEALIRFRVLETRPAPAIDIHNVDLLLDLVLPEGMEHVESNVENEGNKEKREVNEDVAIAITNGNSGKMARKPIELGEMATCSHWFALYFTRVLLVFFNASLSRREVPVDSLERHVAFCERHNILCEQCGLLVARTCVEAHLVEYHTEVTCNCGLHVEQCKLLSHQQTQCPKRPRKCRYCGTTRPASEHGTHVGTCATRTETCPKCAQPIQRRCTPSLASL